MHNACTLVKFLKTQENLPAITADPIKDALFDVETIEDTNTGKVSHVKLIHLEDVTLAKDDMWSFAH